MPMRDEIQFSAAGSRKRESWVDKVWEWIAAIIQNPEFLMLLLFCTVGLWLTLYFIHFFPDFGAVSQSLQPFP